jgi:hypothetical protein
MDKPKSTASRFIAYWRESLNKSQEANDMILYVVFMLSVGFALACAIAGFQIPSLELISDPLTQKLSLLVAILIFVWILFWLPFRRHEMQEKEHEANMAPLLERLRPKFKLSCSKDISACIVPNPPNSMIYFRVVVEADCAIEIENCSGFLTKIEKNGLVIYDHDPRELPFAPSDREDCLTKTLSPNIPYHLDVLCTINIVHAVFIATKGQPCPALNKEGVDVFGEEGDYILHVSVKGKGAPTESAKLRFHWNGNESTATIERIM